MDSRVHLELSEADAWRVLALLKRTAEQDQTDRSYWQDLAGRLANGIYRSYVARRFNGQRPG